MEVPGAEDLAGVAELDRTVGADQRSAGRRGAEGDERVAPELPEVDAIAERDVLEALQVEALPGQPVVAGEAVLHLEDPDPGPGRALGVLDPDDPVEAGQRRSGLESQWLSLLLVK